jgi:hypothetical protein
VTDSPWQRTVAPEVLARLHPRLRTYFGPIPAGHVGRGEGVFTMVGTPRRWLWPVLAVLARDGVLFPVWEHDVPFTVANRPVRVGRGDPGNGQEAQLAVRARRTFRFRSGDRTMVDAIAAGPRGLVDHLGRRGRVSADLRAEVDAHGPDAGVLRLVSTRVSFRALGREWSLPAALSPRVTLTERFDDEADRQRVSLVLSAPILGTLYRYEGAFRYAIAPGQDGEHDE